jgi:hypothetical protein
MPQINSIISNQAFEALRDRIFEILVDELDNQFQLTGDYDLDISVYKESSGPFDISDLPVVNVSLATGDWENRNQGSDDGTYEFNIDIHTGAKNTPSGDGFTAATIKLHQIAGIIRAILRNPVYKTLGYEVGPGITPFILRTFVKNLNIAAGGNQDAMNTAMARLVFTVLANEKIEFIEPGLAEGYDTTVKIDDTNKGYVYTSENYE